MRRSRFDRSHRPARIAAFVWACAVLVGCGTSGDVLSLIPDAANTPNLPAAPEPTSPCARCDGLRCVDLDTDADHCGRCGHNCNGGTCANGRCQPVLVSSGNGFSPGGALALGPSHAFFVNTIEGRVRAVPLAGGTPFTVADVPGVFALAARGDDVYFATWREQAPGTDIVGRASLASGPEAEIARDHEAITSISVDASGAYWASLRGDRAGLHRHHDGVTTELTRLGPPSQLALDGTSVTFTSGSRGLVARVPKAGGPPQVLADGERGPWGLAVTAEQVVWANSEGGEVVSVPLSGGPRRVLAAGLAGPNSVAVDGESVYVTLKQGGAVMRLRGSEVTLLARDPGRPQTVLVRDGQLFWANEAGAIFRMVLDR